MTRYGRQLAGLAVVGTTLALAGVSNAPYAAASISKVSTPQLANTVTAAAETITSSTPGILLTSAAAQLKGPGTGADTYAGTGTKATGSTSSVITTTFNLDPTGLPAAPGSYTLSVCELSCAVPTGLDTATVTVTGPAPTPSATAATTSIAPGATGTITIPGKGFAKDEALSVVRPGAVASDLTFTEGATSTATSLTGSVKVGAAVPPGIYDLLVTDTASQTGICTGCLHVTGGSPTAPAPVTGLTAAATSGSTATATWTAPAGVSKPVYAVTVSKTSTKTTDSGITVAVKGTTATISGLAGASTYYVAVTETSGGATSDPAVATFATANSTLLTMIASKGAIVHGGVLVLHGVLTRTTGAKGPIAKATIKIYAKPAHGKVAAIGKTTTDTKGKYTWSVGPSKTTTYAGFYAGAAGTSSADAGDAATLSSTDPRVQVASAVSIRVKAKSTKHTAPLIVAGHIAPKAAGELVTLIAIPQAGSRQTLATATVDSTSHYRFDIKKPTKAGAYRLEVTIPGRTGNTAGVSKPIAITRT